MGVIYHIAQESQWRVGLPDGAYRVDSLEKEGFIHCSTRQQVLRTANTLFRGQPGLVLVEIDVERLIPALRYEQAEGAERFPHIYGPLNRDAVLRVLPFPPLPDGSFVFPDDSAAMRG